MKIEVAKNNKILVNSSKDNFEIHPLWLRERAETEKLVDKNNHQRLYDPAKLDDNLRIKKASLSNGHLNIEFTDGVKFKYEINELIYELDKKNPIAPSLNCAVIIKQVDEKTRSKTSINDLLRD